MNIEPHSTANVPTPTELAPLRAEVLRSLWKLRRDSYAQAHLYEDARIRVHRSLTWLAMSESRSPNESDTKLIELWASAGALFGRWSAMLGAPLAQREATASFARQVIQWDRDGIMPKVLGALRVSVPMMWNDPYLTQALGMVTTNALANRKPEIPADDAGFLAGLLERIGLTVHQLTLGAASYGGNQNRIAVERSLVALSELVPAFLHVITEHGYVDDWGPLCSPPRE
ncbi:MAG: hypothetical protein O3B75_06510 [Planctomycetota bacterium]|nr:hypothetical protein [Planctomycetota bacterium]